MRKEHKKHPTISRPAKSNFHPNEIAIYGSNCSNIRALYDQLNHVLRKNKCLLFVDADHSSEDIECFTQISKKQFYSDKNPAWNHFDDKLEATAHDIVFVNGNHYPASQQIVMLDPKKKDSLERRKDQLNNILCYINLEETYEIYPFLTELKQHNIPVISSNNIEKICQLILSQFSIPALKALVLAGGQSQRMGKDKSQIDYHGESQEIYLANLLKKQGLEVFLSKSIDYDETEINGIPVIIDRFREMGPFGAILTAFMTDVSSAWLVIACDLPLLNNDTITQLITQRNPASFATAYRLANQEFPEPLITIYEPKIYSRMLQFLSLGYACPRKVLINTRIEEIVLNDEVALKNVNTPEDKLEVERIIEKLK